MTQTLILSHETVRQLLEANAAMAAWYYQLSDALRAAGGEAVPPDEPARLAFLRQLAEHFPEVATVVQSIDHPRAYIPPPAIIAPPVIAPPVAAEEASAPAAPVPPPVAAPVPDPPKAETTAASPPEVAPPPLVDPDKVRYD